jgi:hypothetical protein
MGVADVIECVYAVIQMANVTSRRRAGFYGRVPDRSLPHLRPREANIGPLP